MAETKLTRVSKEYLTLLRKDKHYQEAYIASIAVSCHDAIEDAKKAKGAPLNKKETLKACNEGAKYFMNLLLKK